jgi:hypothetical protein
MRRFYLYLASIRVTGKKFLVGGALLLILALPVFAQSGGPYDLPWFTVSSGGGHSTGGDYALSGTAGQPDAGVVLTGGDYTLAGGFWGGGAVAVEYDIYLPVVLR